MSRLSHLLARAGRKTVVGRPFRARPSLRPRARRDSGRHTSDAVWALVERMMAGDTDAAIVLSDVMEEGVKSGTTKFVKIMSKARQWHGKAIPATVEPNAFAAVTPGRSIVLFGVKDQMVQVPSQVRGEKTKGEWKKAGYLRRFRVGEIAKHGSWNLDYTGPIVAITDKRVTVNASDIGRKANKVMDLETFSNKNWNFDPDASAKRNREWMD